VDVDVEVIPEEDNDSWLGREGQRLEAAKLKADDNKTNR
jgi:hypothetical protein